MLIYIIIFIIAFYLVSFFFLKYPQFIISSKKQWKSNIINSALKGETLLKIAHRGGSRERLENTIEAFDNALRQGTDILELDVRITKDKQVIVVHDNKLRRLCGVNQHVESLNYNEIPKFSEAVDVHFGANVQYQGIDSKSAYMPLLDEVFRRYPSTLINIEIKTPLEENIQLVNALIVKYQREELTIWGCKDQAMSKRMKQINPLTKRFFSFGGVIGILKRFILGVLPFTNIDEDAYEIPIYNTQHYDWKFIKQYPLKKKLFNILYFVFLKVAFSQLFGGALFEHLRKRGVLVLFWVINDIPTLEQAVSYKGCTGIMTDMPTMLTQFLNQKRNK